MNKKELLENYLKKLYKIYEEKNFDFFVNTILSYNIRIGDYNKNIFNISKKIFDEILLQLPESKAKFSYKEFNNYYKINIIYNVYNDPTPKVIIDVPLFIENYEKITINLTNFLIKNKINSYIKLQKISKNPLLEIRVDNENEAKKVVNHFKTDEVISKEIKSRVIPFLPEDNLLGFSYEYKPYNFKNFYYICLYKFFNTIKNEDDVNLDNFENYVDNLYRTERHLNKKRMTLSIYESIRTINRSEDIYNMFKYNSDMNIGSMNPNEYDLKLDKEKMIYFINKIDERIISYGSEEYLNLVYSKFYDNFIKREESSTYYAYFYNIFSKLLSENFKDIDKLLDFSIIQKDYIYTLMMLISSLFFAYKKMGFALNDVYLILKHILFKKYKLDIEVKSLDDFDKPNIGYVFPLNIEYGNKVIDLKNKSKITIKEYFRINKVLDTIPMNSLVYMKDGKILKGEDFLKDIYKYISLYDNFEELRNSLVSLIEFK